MKRLTTILYMVLLTLYAVSANAQEKRRSQTALFKNLPSTINCTAAQLNDLFRHAKGQQVSMSLGNAITIAGPVTSNLVKYSNLQTVVIQLPAFNNTLFSLSKQTENNNTLFVGRILNPAYADGYELKRTTDGNYQLVKIDLEKIVVNCSL